MSGPIRMRVGLLCCTSGAGCEVVHAAMAAAMVAMVVGVVVIPSAPYLTAGPYLAAVFAAPAVLLTCRGVHAYVMSGARSAWVPAEQAVCCAAMVYMLLALSGSQMSSMAPTPDAIAVALALATVLASAGALRHAVDRSPMRAGCAVAMSAATVLMLTVL